LVKNQVVEKAIHPARLSRVGLRRGTRYHIIEDNVPLAVRVLEQGTEVAVRALALNPGEFGVYVLDDGTEILVRYEDEIRDVLPMDDDTRPDERHGDPSSSHSYGRGLP
jgi:hypothetical protein